ncbi:MAG: M48 family metalloprotease [Nitrospinaceae bacterium]
MRFKKSYLAWALAAVSLVWTQTAQSFRLDQFLEQLEKPKQEQPKQEQPSAKPAEPPPQPPPERPQAAPQQPAPSQPSKPKGGGGLIGLGESLGIFDKKTSKILKQSVTTLKAFQPIGYEEEKAIGGSLAVEVFNRFGGMYLNPRLQRYITLVGKSVAEVSGRPDIDYFFAVLNTEQANAFATPGGYVFVSVGLLRLLKNEAQLAGVLGHEIAHITRKHALQTLQRGKVLQGLSSLTLTAMNKNPALFDKVINEVSDILFTRGLDKNLEFEADKYGTEYAYRLGYFPAGLKDFIRILGKARSGQKSIFLSTHPSPGERYTRLTRLLPRYKSAALAPILASRYRSTVQGQL